MAASTALPAWRAVSAAGSLVTYLLEIANVDPIRYGLLFERFLESRTRQSAGH